MFRYIILCLLLVFPLEAKDILENRIPANAFSYGGATSAVLKNGVLTYSGDVNAYSGFFLPFPSGKSENYSDRGSWALQMELKLPQMRTEPFYVALETEEGGILFHSLLPVNRFISLDTTWQKVQIPLSLFSNLGESWNFEKKAGQDGLMNWKNVIGIRFCSDPVIGRESAVVVQIKNLQIRQGKTVAQAVPKGRNAIKIKESTVLDFFNGKIPNGGTHYTYGGISMADIYANNSRKGVSILSLSLSNNDYSGGAFLLGSYFDASAREQFALNFWVKSNTSPSAFYVALIDDESDGEYKSTEVRLPVLRYATIGTAWTQVTVPLRDFSEMGCWWNPIAHSNVLASFDWKHLKGVRFTVDRGMNSEIPVADSGMLKLYLDQISLIELPDSLKVLEEKNQTKTVPAAIHYNHIGYASNAVKKILVTNSEATQFLLLDSNGKKVFGGVLVDNGFWAMTGESVKFGDFSNFTKPGTYSLWISDSLQTKAFQINDSWTRSQFDATLKGFYYQRSGVALDPKVAGKWARPAALLDDHLRFFPGMNRQGTWNAHGGWYDAGDYGKYIVNGGFALASLMFTQELFADKIKASGLLDEIRFELEWFLKMQDSDGGVFFKVGATHWDAYTESPSRTKFERFVIEKSTASSLNFAAALAQAHLVYQKVDPKFAERCLVSAKRAYEWAIQNPSVAYPSEGGGTGLYDDTNFDDEFFWARAMLFRETGDPSLLKQLQLDAENERATLGTDWPVTQNFGWFALALQNRDMGLKKMAREKLEKVTVEILKNLEGNPYRVTQESFYWGSNGSFASIAMTAAFVNSWKKDEALKNAVDETLDYIYGRNPVNVSFVTGSAWSSPKHPHHRLSAGDTIDDPVPGLLVGGINVNREDDINKVRYGVKYPRTEPGFSYVDLLPAYSVNEICINWQAALVFILASEIK
ncbi:MAG: glycoside hydrolase family 9 protein [Fibrobacteraceae bacterium]|nr:glycoside hydrolase family 9 protein [Fibrobacteraceae bacterium]